MSAVEVEIADEQAGAQDAGPDLGPGDGRGGEGRGGQERQQRRRLREPVEVEIEREVTKRQLIQSVSTIVVVVLYMIFTLLRDRDAGVVVVDPSEADDWDEGAG